jgi:transcriptional regulator
MYLPPAFKEKNAQRLFRLIEHYPLGNLIYVTPGGMEATPLPFLVQGLSEATACLQAHAPLANPLSSVPDGTEVLVIFSGPQGYVSPGWYPSKARDHKAVPTWNYATVQVRGALRLQRNTDWVRGQIDRLTALYERDMPQPWSTAEAPPGYIDTLASHLVGVEIEVRQIIGKFKLSQNQPKGNFNGVVEGLKARGEDALVRLMEQPDQA